MTDGMNTHIDSYVPDAKLPTTKIDFAKALGKYSASGDTGRDARLLGSALAADYQAFCSALESTSLSEEGFFEALDGYISVLLALVDGPADRPAAGAAAHDGGAVDAALHQASAEPGAAGAGTGNPAPVAAPPPANEAVSAPAPTSNAVSGRSPLRYAVSFGWGELLAAPSRSSACADAAYELASALVAGGVWCMRRAGALCETSTAGVAPEPAAQAFKLLKRGAGLFQFVAARASSLLAPGASADCCPELLQAAAACCLADAQTITVLRAVRKGNAPALIAALARDGADQYQAAAASLAGVSGAQGCKLLVYLQWKKAGPSAAYRTKHCLGMPGFRFGAVPCSCRHRWIPTPRPSTASCSGRKSAPAPGHAA